MRAFEYFAPQSLDQAVELLAPGNVLLAGGTDLFLKLERRQVQPDAVVDLKRIPGLDSVTPSDNGLRVGALTLMDTLASSPPVLEHHTALARAARVVGSAQTRNRATIGGNLANASPAADTAPALMALGAMVRASSVEGAREMTVDELFVGPGKTALRDGELLAEVVIPSLPARSASSFQRCVRTAMDIAVVNCAAFVRLDGGTIAEARVALGAVGPTPMRATDAERLLVGQPFSAAAAEAAAESAGDQARPIDDVRAGADYRREMVRVLTRRALQEAVERAGGNA